MHPHPLLLVAAHVYIAHDPAADEDDEEEEVGKVEGKGRCAALAGCCAHAGLSPLLSLHVALPALAAATAFGKDGACSWLPRFAPSWRLSLMLKGPRLGLEGQHKWEGACTRGLLRTC